MAEEKVGAVTHYFTKLQVATIRLTDGSLRVGDTIHFHGHTTDLIQKIASMEVEHQSIEVANVGNEIGMKVIAHVREHDEVLRVTE